MGYMERSIPVYVFGTSFGWLLGGIWGAMLGLCIASGILLIMVIIAGWLDL